MDLEEEVQSYSKGRNEEDPLEKEKIPIPNLPEDFVWMQVHGGSKIHALLEVALKKYSEGEDVLWSGSGAALCKAISCAEIMKRKVKNSHQFNKICYRRCREFWDPKLEGLDQLVVVRDVPMIHIFLSHQPFNKLQLGYQGPEEVVRMPRDHHDNKSSKSRKSSNKPSSSSSAGSSTSYSGGAPSEELPGPSSSGVKPTGQSKKQKKETEQQQS